MFSRRRLDHLALEAASVEAFDAINDRRAAPRGCLSWRALGSERRGPKSTTVTATGLTTAEREELARLRKEVRVLREQRNILKWGPGFPSPGETR